MEQREDGSWREALVVLRLIRDWTQNDLADAAGLSFSAISRYEGGSRPASPDLLRELVAAMGFPPHLLARTRSFLRWARAAGASYLADGRVALAVRIDLLEGEAGLWMESLAADALNPVLAGIPSPAAAPPAPPWWAKAVTPAGADATGLPSGASGGGAPLGVALAILRIAHGWSRQQLAAAVGLTRDTIENYERGRTRPRFAADLERLVDVMGFPPGLLDRTVAFVVSSQAARHAHLYRREDPLPAQVADFAAEEARRVEDLARAGLNRLAVAARLLDERRRAPALWARLEGCAEEGRRELVREAAEFQTAGLAELLCEKSRDAAGDSAARAMELAQLAVLSAERAPGEPGWRARVEGYAHAHLANALRVGGDLPAAARELARAEELWSAGAAEDPGLLNEARVLHLQASLLREQRLLSEALAVLDRALVVDRWGETPSLLMGKAKALEELSRFDAAIALLRRAASMVDGERELRTLFVVRAQLLANLCHLGRHGEASLGLAEVRALALRLSNELDLLRVDWLQGRIAAGMGRAEEAIALLERVRAAFEARENAYDTALVTLELAEVHASLGHAVQVKALARRSAPIFQRQGVHPEARRALELFRRAAEEDRFSVQLARSVVTYLYRARHDPGLRFEAAA
jgi:transcriptional regulator with XRE-family HTH domain